MKKPTKNVNSLAKMVDMPAIKISIGTARVPKAMADKAQAAHDKAMPKVFDAKATKAIGGIKGAEKVSKSVSSMMRKGK